MGLTGAKLDTPHNSAKSETPACVSMAEFYVDQLLEYANRHADVVQAPRLNLYNGQMAPLECSWKESATVTIRAPEDKPQNDGIRQVTLAITKKEPAQILHLKETVSRRWRCDVKPVVTADRKSVRLALDFEHLAKVESVEHILRAANTVTVSDGSALVWHVGETAQRQHLFVLVTPRIHVREEEEKQIAPIPRP